MKDLPFTYLSTNFYSGAKRIVKFENLISHFMKTDEIDGFIRWERSIVPGHPSSVLITMKGDSFYHANQTYRSDIKWMWKLIAKKPGRIEIGKNGYLSLLLSKELVFYNPVPVVERAEFITAELMWQWIKYVTSFSWFKQKRGTLRKLLDTTGNHEDMLRTVSIAVIERNKDA